MTDKLTSFYNYCASFYLDEDALYPMIGLTRKELKRITDFFAKGPNFAGDTFDRELVRGALDAFGYKVKS